MYREARTRRPTVTKTLKPWPLDFPPPFLLETLETVPWERDTLWRYPLIRATQFLVTASGALVQILYDAMAVIIKERLNSRFWK